MNAYAQTVANVPVLITFDGEWGLSMRIPDSPRFPQNMALGAISDYRLIYDYGREMARECRLAGVHVNFAPDADVNSNPANPVIGFRSFGEDPQRVAKAAVAIFFRSRRRRSTVCCKAFFPAMAIPMSILTRLCRRSTIAVDVSTVWTLYLSKSISTQGVPV